MSIKPGAMIICGKSNCRTCPGTSVSPSEFTLDTRPSSITTTGHSITSSGVYKLPAVMTVFILKDCKRSADGQLERQSSPKLNPCSDAADLGKHVRERLQLAHPLARKSLLAYRLCGNECLS